MGPIVNRLAVDFSGRALVAQVNVKEQGTLVGLIGRQVQIADIAHEAGVSSAIIHYYYKSKDEVLLAAREALGATVRGWVLATLTAGGPVARRFVDVHHLAAAYVRSLAVRQQAAGADWLDLNADEVAPESEVRAMGRDAAGRRRAVPFCASVHRRRSSR